jgi:iron-sulfur cluster repair protein YtfE (RIC family)
MNQESKIHKDITIEELVTQIPESVSYMMKKGIKCLACGEPIWGTLESASKEKGFNNESITEFVNDLNNMINK